MRARPVQHQDNTDAPETVPNPGFGMTDEGRERGPFARGGGTVTTVRRQGGIRSEIPHDPAIAAQYSHRAFRFTLMSGPPMARVAEPGLR